MRTRAGTSHTLTLSPFSILHRQHGQSLVVCVPSVMRLPQKHVCAAGKSSIALVSVRLRIGKCTSCCAVLQVLALLQPTMSLAHALSASSCGAHAAARTLQIAGCVLRAPAASSGAVHAAAHLDLCMHDAWVSAQDANRRTHRHAQHASRSLWVSCRWLQQEPDWLLW